MGNVIDTDHGRVANMRQALRQVNLGMVDARQVLQFKHHGIGIGLGVQTWNKEYGIGHGRPNWVNTVRQRTRQA